MAVVTEGTINYDDIDTQMQAYGATISGYIDQFIFLSNFTNVAKIPDGLIPSSIEFESIGVEDPFPPEPAKPNINSSVGFYGNYPNIPTSGISALAVPAAPSAPALNFGIAPVTNLPTTPISPVLNTTTLPVKPDLSIPSVPELANISIPDLVVPILPTFNLDQPLVPDELTVPPLSFDYSEADYLTEELTNLENMLNDDLVNGGYGVNHVDEEELFERQRERIRREALIKEEELFDTYSARGFSIPQGDQIDQTRRLQRETLERTETVNLDVSTGRADLIRKSRENTITQTNKLNADMTQYKGFMQQRLLAAAQYASDHSVQLFQEQIKRHNMVIDAYNASVGSYQANISAALSQIDISKTEIEAQALTNEINKSTIDLYQSEIDGAVSLIGLYQAEVDAAKTISDIERDKLGIYQTEIQAYKAQIDGEVSKAQLYATQVGAEEVKSRVYANDVNAFEATVRAEVSKGAQSVSEAEVRVRENSLRVERYRADVDKYRADITHVLAGIDKDLALYSTESSIYGSHISAYASFLSSRISEENIKSTSEIDIAKLELERSRWNQGQSNEGLKTIANSAAVAAQAYAQFANGFASVANSIDLTQN